MPTNLDSKITLAIEVSGKLHKGVLNFDIQAINTPQINFIYDNPILHILERILISIQFTIEHIYLIDVYEWGTQTDV